MSTLDAKDEAKRLTEKTHEAESSFRREHPIIWLFTLIGPFAITGAILAFLFLERGEVFIRQLLYTALATFFLLGKFAILFGRNTEHLGDLEWYEEILQSLAREEIFAMVLYMDLITAALLVFHTGFLFKLPWIGSKMTALVEDGQFIMRSNPWMRQAMFVGLVAFVMFPLAATGSIGGSIFGRLLGMARIRVFIGVALGSVLGCGLMYFLGQAIEPYLKEPAVYYSGVALIVLLVLWLNYRYRKAKKRRLAANSQ